MVEFTFIFVPRKYDFLLKPPSSTTKLPYTKTPSLPISAVFRVFCQPVTSTVAGRHFLDLFHHPCCVSWLHWGNAAKICNKNQRRQSPSYLGKHWWGWDVVFGGWDGWRGIWRLLVKVKVDHWRWHGWNDSKISWSSKRNSMWRFE